MAQLDCWFLTNQKETGFWAQRWLGLQVRVQVDVLEDLRGSSSIGWGLRIRIVLNICLFLFYVHGYFAGPSIVYSLQTCLVPP